MLDPRYAPLFQPLRIGPVTAKNRFCQVPHCNGGGYLDPSAVAELLVTARLPEDGLYLDLKARAAERPEHGIATVKVIGDANAPAAIAWATSAGMRYAEKLDAPDIGDALPFRREIAGPRDDLMEGRPMASHLQAARSGRP